MWLNADLPEKQQVARVQVAMDTLAEIAPREGAEWMLAVQMVGCHEAAVGCLRRAMLTNQTVEGRDQTLTNADRLMNTCTKLLATLDKHPGKRQQKVTVEHVHVEASGQAIVGRVEGRGHDDTLRPDPRSIDHAPGAAVDAVRPKETTRQKRKRGDGE